MVENRHGVDPEYEAMAADVGSHGENAQPTVIDKTDDSLCSHKWERWDEFPTRDRCIICYESRPHITTMGDPLCPFCNPDGLPLRIPKKNMIRHILNNHQDELSTIRETVDLECPHDNFSESFKMGWEYAIKAVLILLGGVCDE